MKVRLPRDIEPVAVAAFRELRRLGLDKRFFQLSLPSRRRIMLVLRLAPEDTIHEHRRLGVQALRRLHLRLLACNAHKASAQELEDLIALEESTWVGRRD